MAKITCKFRTSEERGVVSFNAKYDEKFYKKYNMNFMDRVGCGSCISLKDLRYINYSDKISFVLSSSYEILKLCHKRHRTYSNPPGFDHTTSWRKIGDKFPSFYLTEPYHLNENTENEMNEVCKNHPLKFKIFKPSDKSLWVPNSTYMIFWYCPEFFNFEEHKDLLLSHENGSEFEKLCTKISF